VSRSALARARELCDVRAQAFALTGLGLVAAAAGRPDEAFDRLLEALQIFRGCGARHEAASILVNLGNVAQDVGDDQRAARFFDGARQLFDELAERRGSALCLNNLALLAGAHGDIDHAIERGRQALDHFTAVGDLHGEAAMLNNLAGWWEAQGAASEATTLYEQAIARFEKLGDTAGQRTAQTNLDGLRATPSGLSTREVQVAGLVADGLANREIAAQLFISERTVHSHLSHIFSKLGLTSRTQLATWADRRGLSGGGSAVRA
jgi:ATP/maltotriose-dependent transcriptional regulator MalT